MKRKIIACLPVAGDDNPYQKLMMEGLNQSGQLRAFNGVHDKFWGILRTALKHKPNYIHFDWIASYYYRRYNWLTYISILFFLFQVTIVKYLGIKIVWTLHNILPHDLEQIQLHRFCQRFLAKRCEWIRVFAKETAPKASELLQVPISKFKIVPEGSYTTTYPNTVTRKEARAYLGLPGDKKIFLYLGLIKPYKGIPELLHAFNGIDTQDKLLIIAGRVPDLNYGNKIKAAITPNVIFRDQFIPEHELQYYFNSAEIVVLPFLKIENSGSLILAMGFAKPVIAPMEGTIKERLFQQKDLLFTNPDQLRQKLLLSLNLSDEALKNIGISNFNQLKQFQWSDFAKAFL